MMNSERLELDIPTIDFQGGVDMYGSRRGEVVEEIRKAAEGWGLFRIVNHSVSVETMDVMLEAVTQFHNQPMEEKMQLHSDDARQRVRFTSSPTVRDNGRMDLLACTFLDDQLNPEDIPIAFRKEISEYVKGMIQLREVMAELLSEALGLTSDYFSNMECAKSQSLACLGYPVCSEPENKTSGTVKHTNGTFFTILMQDNIGGLQIVHDNQWLNVRPQRGALITSIGDLTQIISNDKFKSVEHRVVTEAALGASVSVACYFTPSLAALGKPFAPIQEIVSEENPAVYRAFMFMEYMKYHKETGEAGAQLLAHFKN